MGVCECFFWVVIQSKKQILDQTNGLIADKCQIFVNSNWLNVTTTLDQTYARMQFSCWYVTYKIVSLKWKRDVEKKIFSLNEIDFNKNEMIFASIPSHCEKRFKVWHSKAMFVLTKKIKNFSTKITVWYV